MFVVKQSESLPTKQVSLDDLKRAIACYTAVDGDTWAKEAGGSDYASRRWHALSFAWRTAFEWREDWRKRCQGIALQSIQWSAHCDEGDEGMRLVREKLG